MRSLRISLAAAMIALAALASITALGTRVTGADTDGTRVTGMLYNSVPQSDSGVFAHDYNSVDPDIFDYHSVDGGTSEDYLPYD